MRRLQPEIIIAYSKRRVVFKDAAYFLCFERR